jgi:hypothetical protein
MKEFNQKLQEQFQKMSETGRLFRSSVSGYEVWDLYIKAFSEEDDPIFRDPSSSSHNCNLCKNFIRRYGNIVAVNPDYSISTIFDVEADDEYAASAKAISKALKKAKIAEVFFETFNELNSLPYESCSRSNLVFRLGMAQNVKRYTKEEAEKYGVVKPNQIITFNHMHLSVSNQFVNTSGASVESIMGSYRDAKNVFQKAMEIISLDTLQLVKDLINQGSLLDGQTHLYKIESIIPLKREYDELSAKQRENWCWVKSYNLPIAKFKNELIGVLCTELAEGEELNKACQSWNKRVDPVNYMKTTAPITKKQIEEAKKFVEENGYVESFNRRFATIDDIKVSEILHSNVGEGKVKTVSIFDGVKSTSTRHKRNEFDGVETVSIEKFMKDILPGCTSVEAFLTNQHEGHMVSLTTANDPNSKPIFKWSNNYSWTFNGNLAGKSQIKEAVKAAGGKVDGVLRFSIGWNDDGRSICDFDAHAIEPDKTEIAFNTYRGQMHSSRMSGFLDVDMIRPAGKGVENITWTKKSAMKDGTYTFFNRNYDGGKNTGFKAEVEFEGELFCYEYSGEAKGDVQIATVTKKGSEFTIKHHLPETNASRKIYNLDTNEFHKVNLVCLSPNHWGDNNTGNKHYLFMLENCKAPEAIRSFHNENLLPELATHRKVLEVLGATNKIEPTDKQLSGLGFNATVKDELIVKLSGSHKRVVKIQF